ncbi:MAG TPA: hypothetical protein VL049_29130, partial [Candidatus Dormibacteraeota bacterium]|nr:hypothetical protein [Candidatus Dormibacteraeota bacterium]
NLISDLLGSFNIPPLSLEAFEVYVRSSLEAAFVSEFAIAFDEGKPDPAVDHCGVPQTNLHMQSALDALGQIGVKAGMKIEFVLDLGFFSKHFLFNPEVNVVDLTPVDKMLITSPEAAARMQVDGPPPASPQAYASFASFSAPGPQDGRAFVDACLEEPPPAPQEMPAPSFEPGDPQDLIGMQEFPCNICLFFPSQITQVCAPKPGVPSDYPCPLAINGMPCIDDNDKCQNVPVSPAQSVNLKQVLFNVSQSGLPPDKQWMCNAFEKFGCFDLCHYDPNSMQPLTITQSAVDKIGTRCRDATGGSDPTIQGLACGSAAECEDGNPCTVKTCSGPEIKTCSITNSDGPCDDGLFCNGADTCALGICGAHAGNPCSATAKCCDEATDICPASCPGTPCEGKNVGDPCDDGTVCSTGDHCVSSIAGPLCRGDLAIACASSTCTAGLCTDVQGQPECVSVPSGACPPGCGNGSLDPDEQCDGTADAACPGKCLPDCSCPVPPPEMNGEPCQTAGQCASQHCVDGVCCDTSCAGPLEQCNLPGQVGTCAVRGVPVPTLSRAAVLIVIMVLVAVAGLAWRRRASS